MFIDYYTQHDPGADKQWRVYANIFLCWGHNQLSPDVIFIDITDKCMAAPRWTNMAAIMNFKLKRKFKDKIEKYRLKFIFRYVNHTSKNMIN